MKKELCAVSIVGLILCQARNGRADEAEPKPEAAVTATATGAPAPDADHPAAGKVDKSNFKEPGRFGLLGAVTSDGFQFGAARVGEHYEVVLTADASYAEIRGGAGSTGDIGTTLRAGPRFGLGQLNYLVVGAQGHTSLFGRDNGVSTMGQYALGPYVGLERHFAGTPLMISLWVLPYQFERTVANDGSGGRQVMLSHQFFQGGGFGLTYLL
jgi:hypothetical protein